MATLRTYRCKCGYEVQTDPTGHYGLFAGNAGMKCKPTPLVIMDYSPESFTTSAVQTAKK